jgi:hypothetical protein
MANLIRENMPLVHAAVAEFLSDEAEYTPLAGLAFTIAASPFDPPQDGGRPSYRRNFAVRELEFAVLPVIGDKVLHLGTQYTVLDAEYDNAGGIILITERA